jgi:hypothetical protein
MLQRYNIRMEQISNNKRNTALRKAHHVGASVVVTIDPTIVKKVGIDDMTFFAQEVIDGGIFLKVRKFAAS